MKNLHFIPNTHLDREWSLDFQHTRHLTMRFLDHLLEIMDEVPEYTFLLDSQAVPLEDYFELRPENREKVGKLIADQRLFAGPWYDALEMNCLKGESIIRNLLHGHLIVEEFGPVCNVGYTPFGWGQVGQLPQIYKGFGIESVIFYRGITTRQAPNSEFVWKGADGTELLGSRLGTPPRMNFYMRVWRPAFFAHLPDRINRRLNWTQDDGTPFRLCDEPNRYDHGKFLEHKKELNLDSLRDNLRNLIDGESKVFGTSEISFMHGFDTSTPDIREKEVVEACQQYLEADEKLFFSSLPAYMEAVAKAVDFDALPRIIGESRYLDNEEFGYATVGNDILSSRTRQKAKTARAETILASVAEPFAAMNYLLGGEWPEQYLNKAWLQFLKCHPHDTLGGCGLDQIERDSNYRLDDAISLAKLVSKESLSGVQLQIDTSAAGKGDVVLTVFNPSAHTRSETVAAYIDLPDELGESVKLVDFDGNEIDCAITPTGISGRVYRDAWDFALGIRGREATLVFEANVPALGYKSYRLIAGSAAPLADMALLENQFVKAAVQPNGTLTLTDKTTGETFEKIAWFENSGECGHGWTHVEPENARRLTTLDAKATINVLEQTAMRTRIAATVVLDVPVKVHHIPDGGNWMQSTRDATTKPMTITTEYTLNRNDRAVGIKVSFRNECTDHRLRIMFPTAIAAKYVHADMAFDVVKRPIDRTEENQVANLQHQTQPFQRFVSLQQESRSFAFVGQGLKEYEVLDDRTIGITLMRGFRNDICTFSVTEFDHQVSELSQSLGQHEFAFRITTENPGDGFAALYREHEVLSAPMTLCQSRSNPGTLPHSASLLGVDNDVLVLSGIKKASRSNELIVRLFNPSEHAQQAVLTVFQGLEKASLANLNEEIQSGLAVKGNAVELSFEPKKIVTVALKLK